MDIKEYIESGILERYIFQDATPQEMQEVQCMSKIYPEIAKVIEEYQSTVENMAMKTAVAPPLDIKTRILERIKTESQEEIEKPERKKDNVVQMKVPNYKLYMAACVIGLLCMFGYSVLQSNKIEEANSRLANVESEYDDLRGESLEILDENLIYKENLAFVTDVNTSKIDLNGTENYTNSKVTVYWNKENNKVLLEQNQLAQLEESTQYQLWAIVEGKPVDLGVFDTEINTLNYYKDVNSPQAFAITIEPRGGSVSPTMENMVVIGNVGS